MPDSDGVTLIMAIHTMDGATLITDGVILAMDGDIPDTDGEVTLAVVILVTDTLMQLRTPIITVEEDPIMAETTITPIE